MPSPVTLDLRFGDGIEFWKGFYQTLTSCIPKLYPPYFEEPFEQTKFSFEKCFPNSMPSPVTLDLRFGDGIEFWKGFYQTLTSLGSLRLWKPQIFFAWPSLENTKIYRSVINFSH